MSVTTASCFLIRSLGLLPERCESTLFSSLPRKPLLGQSPRPKATALPLRDRFSFSYGDTAFSEVKRCEAQIGNILGGGRRCWRAGRGEKSATQNPWGMWALVSLLVFLTSTPFPFLQLPTTTARNSVGRQRQLCPLAASDVPTAALHCRVPRVIKYAEGCWSPLYHSQKCHVLRVGSHWALVPASRRL